ncbi:hypothetical protein [Nocardiopsis sp. YSL2]|uniref:hypothetical protein n=1 Tax=Nocardiopsis sp. YSL2 TaxID=2939492 RepID=UPI0026F44B55|nr:hypothetical protein [Nocardiopsis sp. YSL2]
MVDVVAWEGDDELHGDRVTVDGRVLVPQDGYATGDNAFVGSARGAVGDPMAFGTDVLRTAPGARARVGVARRLGGGRRADRCRGGDGAHADLTAGPPVPPR